MFVSRTCPQCHTCQNRLVIRDLYAKKRHLLSVPKYMTAIPAKQQESKKLWGRGWVSSGVEVELRTF